METELLNTLISFGAGLIVGAILMYLSHYSQILNSAKGDEDGS